MRAAFIAATFFLSACHPAMETKEHHYIHKGEHAVLSVAGHDHAYLAVTKTEATAMAHAVEKRDATRLRRLIDEGKVVEVANGTRVDVTGESFNEREVKITEGTLAGRTGWVVLEWLQVPTAKKL